MITQDFSVENLKEEIKHLKDENLYLKEQIELFKRKLFGKKSEKIIGPSNEEQLYLPGFEPPVQPPAPKKDPIAAHERTRKSKGEDKITLSDDLPIEKHILDIPEEEKICSETGQPLIKIGEELTSKIAYKPGSYYIKQFIRPKYALPQNNESGIRMAPLPESLLSRCQADESFLADILSKKFSHHLPLYRIAEITGQSGVNISRQILSKWTIRCGQALKPLYKEMTRQVLLSENVFIDETPIDLLDPGKGKTHQAFMWVLVGGKAADPPCRVYNFRTNRKHHNALELLSDYHGVFHSDKYGAYEKLAQNKQFTWCPCYVHIRRKFF